MSGTARMVALLQRQLGWQSVCKCWQHCLSTSLRLLRHLQARRRSLGVVSARVLHRLQSLHQQGMPRQQEEEGQEEEEEAELEVELEQEVALEQLELDNPTSITQTYKLFKIARNDQSKSTHDTSAMFTPRARTYGGRRRGKRTSSLLLSSCNDNGGGSDGGGATEGPYGEEPASTTPLATPCTKRAKRHHGTTPVTTAAPQATPSSSSTSSTAEEVTPTVAAAPSPPTAAAKPRTMVQTFLNLRPHQLLVVCPKCGMRYNPGPDAATHSKHHARWLSSRRQGPPLCGSFADTWARYVLPAAASRVQEANTCVLRVPATAPVCTSKLMTDLARIMGDALGLAPDDNSTPPAPGDDSPPGCAMVGAAAVYFLYVQRGPSSRSPRRVLGCAIAEPITETHSVLRRTPPVASSPVVAAAGGAGGGAGAGAGATASVGSDEEASVTLSQPHAEDAADVALGISQVRPGCGRVLVECGHLTLVVAAARQVWVAEKARRQGIASRLLDAACRTALVGQPPVARHELAFTQTTVSGTQLAKQFTGSSCFFIYQ